MNKLQRKAGKSVSLIHRMLLVLALGAGTALAQEPKAGAPQPPYLVQPPPNSEWTAVVQQNVKRPQPTTPQEVQTEKELTFSMPQLEGERGSNDGRRRVIEFQWDGGRKSWIYVVDGVSYQSAGPNYPEIVRVYDGSMPGSKSSYVKTDFPSLGWVGPDTFAGTATAGGARCYLYVFSRDPGAKAGAAGTSRGPLKLQVWINALTRLPVQYDDGGNLWTFTYINNTTATLTPPECFLEAAAAHQNKGSK